MIRENDAVEVIRLLNDVLAIEGSSVRLVNDNPDFGGPNCAIFVARNFGEEHQFFGDTIVDCLREAISRGY